MPSTTITLYLNRSLILARDETVTLSPRAKEEPPLPTIGATPPQVPSGNLLGPDMDTPCFRALNTFWLPGNPEMEPGCFLRCLRGLELEEGEHVYSSWKDGYTLATITLSDKAHAGLRSDASGPLAGEMVFSHLSVSHSQHYVLPDEPSSLRSLLHHLGLEQRIDLILTTGGTGVTSRDITPEATAFVLDRELPGFERAMTAASLAKTPQAVLSRAKAGILGRSLIINLPGSKNAVRDNLEVVLPALKHTLDKINDDPGDCANV